jgi:rare lipoprotein A
MRTTRRFILLVLGSLVTLAGAHALAQGTPAPVPSATPAAAPVAAPAPAAVAPAGAEKGRLAWYGRKFAGRRTASGEAYNPDAMTMAHKTLPFGTMVEVTNLANGRKAKLRVNDRGPTQADRVGDVSLAAARALGMTKAGVVDASIVVLSEPKPGAKKG